MKVQIEGQGFADRLDEYRGRLVGSVNASCGIRDYRNFLEAIEAIMYFYNVSRLDLSWSIDAVSERIDVDLQRKTLIRVIESIVVGEHNRMTDKLKPVIVTTDE
jgi:hypothetical protein